MAIGLPMLKWVKPAASQTINDLTNQLFADAEVIGIKRAEIDEEVDSLYRTLLDAIVHYDPGLPE